MNGVMINELADNMGTDVRYIQKTYSHVTNEMRAHKLTKQIVPEFEDKWAGENEYHRTDFEVQLWENIQDIHSESGEFSIDIEKPKKHLHPADYTPVKGTVVEQIRNVEK